MPDTTYSWGVIVLLILKDLDIFLCEFKAFSQAFVPPEKPSHRRVT